MIDTVLEYGRGVLYLFELLLDYILFPKCIHLIRRRVYERGNWVRLVFTK